DISDPMVCSKVEQCLREDAFRLFALLKENEDAFRDSYISQTAIHAGYRESRRIRGNHILTGTELIQRTHFDDTIACSGHPVDIHIAQSMRQDVTFLAGEGYIPFRSLYTDYLDNLLVAGRCISADRDAFASVRVQAPCMAMGQAAGTAAALCIQDSCSVSELDSKKLVDILIMQDACL
ncbi:MAG: FAD-dependent oxidoreductase, partial [Spirochaetales bacterium]|nr:FAD-dependent oxidoreductase [Spirochaetales bacterium]